MNKNYCCSPRKWLKLVCLPFLACLFSQGAIGQLYYTFASQTVGTYTPITGGTVLVAGPFDENVFAVSGLPSFTFNGNTYTDVNVSSNGFVTIGTTAPATFTYNSLASTETYAGSISVFGRDCDQAATGTPEIRYEVIGNEIIFQWQDFKRWNLTGERISAQARINTVTSEISIVYGGTITVANSVTGLPVVGLRGASNTNFNNRRVTTAETNWDASIAGTLNTHSMRLTSGATPQGPMAGLTYAWTYSPPTCLPPTGISLTHTSATAADIAWSAAPTVFIEWGPNGYTPGTGATAGGSATGSTSSSSSPFNITGLNDGDDIYIRQDCGAGDFSTNVFHNFLVGDECGSAAAVTCGGGPYTGSTVGFSVGADPTGGTGCGAGGYVAPTRWFSMAGSDQIVTVDLGLSAYDTRVTIMSGSCGALTCVAGDDDSGPGTTSLVTFNAFLGTDYYIIVHGFSGSGTYSMAINCATLCTPITTNDECASPTAVPLNTPTSGNNECATASAQGPISFDCGGSFASYTDVWFSFTSSAFVDYALTINSLTSGAPQAAGPYYVSIMTACGAGTTCTAFDPSVGLSTPLVLTPATGYIVRVYVSSDNVGSYVLGNFDVQVDEVTCPQPTALGVTNVGDDTVDLTWTQNSGATGFEIDFGPDPFTPDGVADYTGSYPTPFGVSGLTASTLYTYYVRDDCGAGDFSAWSGPFTFSTGLVNDACSDAIAVTCPSNVAGTTTGAQSDLAQVPDDCSPTGGGRTGVWYSYAGDDQQVTLDFCNVGTDFDTQVSVFDGTCGALSCVAGNDDGGESPACDLFPASPFKSRVTWNAYLGTTYYIFVHGFSDFDAGNFQMDITCDVLCLPVPANDECASAEVLTVGATCVGTSGSTSCANASTVNNPGCMSSPFGTYSDVWYQFQATDVNHDLRITLGTAVNVTVNLYVTDDCTPSALNAADAGCLTYPTDAASGEDVQITGLTIGDDYFIRVVSENGDEGTFDICFWENPCPFPTAFVLDSADETSFSLSWTENGTATQWDVFYEAQPTAADPDEFTVPTIDNTTNPATITGLPAETCYSVWIRSDNPGASCTSVWVGPLTVCTAPAPPDCASSPILVCGASANATTSAGIGAWNLGDDNAGPFSTPGKENVYRFTATGNGDHFIQVITSTGIWKDYYYKPASDGCSSTGWTYIDDMFGAGNSVAFSLTAGVDYYIAADAEGTAAGNHQFRVLCPTPAPVNDSPAGAIYLAPSGNVYPACGALSGDLTFATASPEDDASFTGVDNWYRFTASSNAVSITLSSGTIDGAIAIYDFDGVNYNLMPGATEDVTFGGQTEILNYDGLTTGQDYWVAVGAWSIFSTAGPYSICIKRLVPSTCDDGPGTYSLCSSFKADWTGANAYESVFTQTAPAAGPTTSAQAPGLLSLATPALGLQHGYSYDVVVNGIFDLVDGGGNPEQIIVPGTAVCPITIAPQVELRTKIQQRCPATVLKGHVLQAKPFICAAVNHTAVFTEVTDCTGSSTIGIPFPVTTAGSSSTIHLASVPQIIPGHWYAVNWTPNFAWGPGTTGTTDVIQVAMPMRDEMNADQPFEEESLIEAALYPNPNNGDLVNMNIAGVQSDNVLVRIMDNLGRVIYTNRFTVNGSLNTIVEFTRPLASGLYMVEFTVDGEVITERLMVQK